MYKHEVTSPSGLRIIVRFRRRDGYRNPNVFGYRSVSVSSVALAAVVTSSL